MATYIVEGYTSSAPDFRGTIELPLGFEFEDIRPSRDPRFSRTWNVLKAALLASDADVPSDYLDVFDSATFELRDDLASDGEAAVLLGESYGCDNCQDPDGDGSGNGDNEYTTGCSDTPHGVYMIRFSVAS